MSTDFFHPKEWLPEEEDWEQLQSEQRLSARRRAAEEQYRELSAEDIRELRRQCKTDLFFLGRGPLEYNDLSVRFHGDLFGWMERTIRERYRILLLPRGHFKSTCDTIIDSIQIALTDDEGDQPYPRNLGPNVKLLIGHETAKAASRFLFEIAEAFTSKPLMLALYPELIPSKRNGQRINQEELELPRQTHHKEPTFDTIGTGGRAQGRHYNRLKLDDLIGEAARESPTVMTGVLDWFDNINSLLTRLKLDGWDLIGTRWAIGDLYSHAMKKYGVRSGVSRLIREDEFPEGLLAAYVRGVLEEGAPIFPEWFSMEDLEILRKNPKVWGAQYANDPKDSGLTKISPRWFKFYNRAGTDITSDLIVFEHEKTRRVSPFALDRIALVDPSVGENEGSDPSGIAVTGTDAEGRVYILEIVKKRLNPPDLIRTLIELDAKWRLRTTSIEEVAFSSVYRWWIDREASEMGRKISITPYPPAWLKGHFYRARKTERIEGLIPLFSAGQIYMAEGMHDLRDEAEAFPLGGTDPGEHLLDALAQGPAYWMPHRAASLPFERRSLQKKILEARSALSGY